MCEAEPAAPAILGGGVCVQTTPCRVVGFSAGCQSCVCARECVCVCVRGAVCVLGRSGGRTKRAKSEEPSMKLDVCVFQEQNVRLDGANRFFWRSEVDSFPLKNGAQ